jgi:bifunctional UDP-N-acetylglucosamine pyrophosphorylase / glucosamine-1-phosphate N-acetyltransferase
VPKVLHRLAGRPLVHYPIRAAREAGAERVIVVVSREHAEGIAADLEAAFGPGVCEVVVQDPPLGTGDAARVALTRLRPGEEHVLILCGDTPLVQGEDLRPLLRAVEGTGPALAVLSCRVLDPRGYGRIRRDGRGAFVAIVEERDLESDAARAIDEVNAGMYAGSTSFFGSALAVLTRDNAQGEYYLTDVVATARQHGGAVAVLGSRDALVGVNDRAQLVEAEEILFARIRQRHAEGGATLHGDARVDDAVELGMDVEVGAGVALRGATKVGDGAVIDVGSVITDSIIGARCRIRPYSVLEKAVVGEDAVLGPFCHLRPGSDIGPEAHVGNFVETKNTRMGRAAKANHLAYLGDGRIGERVNIGAGTIFCNYDGFKKHETVIENGAFVGSDSQIVAPVRIGVGAYVATGTTVTQDVPDNGLAISRVKQQNKEGYASRLKARLARGKRG